MRLHQKDVTAWGREVIEVAVSPVYAQVMSLAAYTLQGNSYSTALGHQICRWVPGCYMQAPEASCCHAQPQLTQTELHRLNSPSAYICPQAIACQGSCNCLCARAMRPLSRPVNMFNPEPDSLC